MLLHLGNGIQMQSNDLHVGGQGSRETEWVLSSGIGFDPGRSGWQRQRVSMWCYYVLLHWFPCLTHYHPKKSRLPPSPSHRVSIMLLSRQAVSFSGQAGGKDSGGEMRQLLQSHYRKRWLMMIRTNDNLQTCIKAVYLITQSGKLSNARPLSETLTYQRPDAVSVATLRRLPLSPTAPGEQWSGRGTMVIRENIGNRGWEKSLF